MRRIIEHIQNKPPHEKRHFSMQASAILVGMIFLGWISTLGLRLSDTNTPTVARASDQNIGLVAAVYGASSMISEQVGKIRATVASVGQGSVSWDGTGQTSAAVQPPVPSASVLAIPSSASSTGDDVSQ